MKITESTLCFNAGLPLKCKVNVPSVYFFSLCFAYSFHCYLNAKIKTQIADMRVFSPSSHGLRYFKCRLSFRGRAALNMSLLCVSNCHPESLTV